MKKLSFILLIFLCASMLSACGDNRAARDKKLAKGCEAGVQALLDQKKYDHQISAAKTSKFSDASDGRQVILQATTKNKEAGYEQEEAFTCVFSEDTVWGPFGYKAELQQLTIGDEIFGKKDGQILGDMNDFMGLDDAVSAAMK